MLSEMLLKGFIEKVSSAEPVPGGGSVAALCAALSAALIEMVLNITKNKKSNDKAESEIYHFIDKLEHLKTEFLENIDRDASAFAQVMDAYRLPKNTESEKKFRRDAIEKALKWAAQIPMEVAEKAFQLFELSRYIVLHGNKNAITDSAVSVVLARGAIISALYNVRINLASIKDEGFKKEMEVKTINLQEETIKKEKEILDIVDKIMAEEG